MRSKKLLFTTLLMGSGLLAFFTLTSTSNATSGVMGASTVGCSCHGVANAATTIEITGIPASGWVAGTAYTINLAVKNSTKAAAGFDMTVTGGTISGAPANTMLMGGTELHHTAPKMAASGNTIWSFTWTAPAAGTSVTFNVAGNAVNNTGNENGDQWALASISFNKATPSSVDDVTQNKLSVYPNPVGNALQIRSNSDEKLHFDVFSITGSQVICEAELIGNGIYQLNTTDLPSGNYFVRTSMSGKIVTLPFTRK